MAFDVIKAYNFLVMHGVVFSVRPYQTSLKPTLVHLHVNHKWTGHIASRVLITSGKGKRELKKELEIYYYESGFDSFKEWLTELTRMHGEKSTTQYWAIYKVTLVKEDE